ncbi:5'-3' exonuclease [Georgenia subflava]|uniref:5'-3' exonuclease n=1 Tax=Georgenia subflava TaxID=1622177 RepID=A0A6N7EE81_9MICO|nr:5'-3' exonuclease [Georgenia subflava]MPV36330.1 flap endonuclease [Georgenia subflava]
MSPTGPLLLLDSASMYFRAFYGVPSSITAADGTSVNAVRGFLDMIAQLVTDRRPGRIVACWDDDWRPAFRVDAIPSYKEHRLAADGGEEVPEALKPQVPIVVDVLAALGIARVGAPGFEADDVIGTLVARELAAPAAERADAVEVVTGDRDLFQLVDDAAGVSVLYPAKGFKNLIVVDQAVLAEKYGVPTGTAYADMATLRGDPSDGLPGVAGIGEKTAASMLRTYGTLAGVLAAVDAGELSATQRARIGAARAYLDVAPTVVQVARDAPVGEFDDAVPTVPADPETVAALAEQWNLGGSMTRVVEALTKAGQ